MDTPLTTGALERVLTKNAVESFVLQVLSVKCTNTGQHDRYRMLISDGKHAMGSCMLGTQLNNIGKDIRDFSIILVHRYVCEKIIESKMVIIVLDLTILNPGEQINRILGNPQIYEFVPPMRRASSDASNLGTSNDVLLTPLTIGALERIIAEEAVETPVIQVLSTKVFKTGQLDRYRMQISDGKHIVDSCILGTQLNKIASDITDFSVIRVDRYVCCTLNASKKAIVILELTFLHPGEQINNLLGKPINFEFVKQEAAVNDSSNAEAFSVTSNPIDEQLSQTNAFNSPTNFEFGPQVAAVIDSSNTEAFSVSSNPIDQQLSQPNAFNTPIGSNNENNQSSSSAANASFEVHPIKSLVPYQNKWTICARVTNKTFLRKYNNPLSQGKFFSIDFIDESGEIRAVVFNELCDKFYNMIKVDKVYYISQAQLTLAKKEYSSLKNDYEMIFNQDTTVTLCQQNLIIPSTQFHFVSIDQIEQVGEDTIIDVLGVCKEVEDISFVNRKTTGEELMKRELQIFDESGKEIRITLWDAQAENFGGSRHSIVALRGVKVSYFKGKCLSSLSSTSFQINPDITEAHQLRAWYKNTRCNLWSERR